MAYKILIVDDETNIRRGLKAILAKAAEMDVDKGEEGDFDD